MSLPALRAVRESCPSARITVLARPWVADLYARERFADQVIPYPAARGLREWGAKLRLAGELGRHGYDCAILFPNAFESALFSFAARIPHRIGYRRDGRGLLLTHAIPCPRKGEIPPHESFYYLELLRRAGFIECLPKEVTIRLDGLDQARQSGLAQMRDHSLGHTVIGVSPGAAFGGAKRWFPERFAEAAATVAKQRKATVALFGSTQERELCGQVAAQVESLGVPSRNLAGQTTLSQFIELVSACLLFLTNDSGSMHIAAAAGVPTVAVFGATNHITTGPTGPLARVIREPVECSPCLMRECPIDHRCMDRVPAGRVSSEALLLIDQLRSNG
ncbi:MAG: lipopolysaccharide heptosyltransferase II [Acidobacteriia bacterium]|nr:lipopolysaccharide heptosyltransferase II [Terriglobia bacterium]